MATTLAMVQGTLFSGDPAAEKLPEYVALLAESRPARSWGPIITAEIAADRLGLPHCVFRECIEFWDWPPIPARGAVRQ